MNGTKPVPFRQQSGHPEVFSSTSERVTLNPGGGEEARHWLCVFYLLSGERKEARPWL